MIKNKTIFNRALGWVSALIIIIASPLSHAQDPVTVRVVAVHYNGDIQYRYQVSNHTAVRNIAMVNIGDAGRQIPNPAIRVNLQPEITVFPVGSYWGSPTATGDQRGTSLRLGGLVTSPLGWTVVIQGYEGSYKSSINWTQADDTLGSSILPGQTFNFSVTTPLRGTEPFEDYVQNGDTAYLTGHFTVRFDDNEKPRTYTGTIVPIDTTPPILTITPTPATLWPPNSKLVPITATITVKDDYDPQPEIKLESITSSELLGAGEIQNAQLGTDDRQFNLAAKREGSNLAGRVYTLTYSATDGSGNKATASTTVTVPHDQR